jgi:hypothetical protein
MLIFPECLEGLQVFGERVLPADAHGQAGSHCGTHGCESRRGAVVTIMKAGSRTLLYPSCASGAMRFYEATFWRRRMAGGVRICRDKPARCGGGSDHEKIREIR